MKESGQRYVRPAAPFAHLSAASFPATLVCPGTHSGDLTTIGEERTGELGREQADERGQADEWERACELKCELRRERAIGSARSSGARADERPRDRAGERESTGKPRCKLLREQAGELQRERAGGSAGSCESGRASCNASMWAAARAADRQSGR